MNQRGQSKEEDGKGQMYEGFLKSTLLIDLIGVERELWRVTRKKEKLES